jgi:hypothetical protein
LIYWLHAVQVSSLPSYAAAAQRLGLVRLGQGITDACAQPDVWAQLQQNKQVRAAPNGVVYNIAQHMHTAQVYQVPAVKTVLQQLVQGKRHAIGSCACWTVSLPCVSVQSAAQLLHGVDGVRTV